MFCEKSHKAFGQQSLVHRTLSKQLIIDTRILSGENLRTRKPGTCFVQLEQFMHNCGCVLKIKGILDFPGKIIIM